MKKYPGNRFSHLILPMICWLSASLLETSCQKSISEEFSDQPVVEAYLIPGQKVSVKITRKTPYETDGQPSATDLNTLDIKVNYNGTWLTLLPCGEGVYSDTAGVIPVIPDSTYILAFNFNQNDVSSSTIIPVKPTSVTQSVTTVSMEQFDPDNPSWSRPPDPIEIGFANNDESYYFLTVECIDTVLVPVYKDSIPANDILSTQPVAGTQINIQPMSIRYFGKNRIILYHITPEYSIFFMQQASTSQNYQNPPTNIENGLGIFTGINADTLFLDVVQTEE